MRDQTLADPPRLQAPASGNVVEDESVSSSTNADLARTNAITQRIIGAAIEVHRYLGPGLAERIYCDALSIEFAMAGIQNERELSLPVVYKGQRLGRYVVDFLVEAAVVVEVKSVDRLLPVFEAQLMNYMKLTGSRLGLLINFNSRLVKEGIKRVIL